MFIRRSGRHIIESRNCSVHHLERRFVSHLFFGWLSVSLGHITAGYNLHRGCPACIVVYRGHHLSPFECVSCKCVWATDRAWKCFEMVRVFRCHESDHILIYVIIRRSYLSFVLCLFRIKPKIFCPISHHSPLSFSSTSIRSDWSRLYLSSLLTYHRFWSYYYRSLDWSYRSLPFQRW